MAATSRTRKNHSVDDDRAAHLDRLAELEQAARARLLAAETDYRVLAEAGRDVGAGDDEGGGEADVTTVERDRLRAAIGTDTELLETIAAAVARAAGDGWDICSSCGGPIPHARLELIPTTDRCVTCKAASTTW